MITVTVTKQNGLITGFEFTGHADYAEEGSDIICSAVSVLAINTVNSIEVFTEDNIEVEEPEEEEGGYLKFSVPAPSEKTALLFQSLELGIRSVMESYGKTFLEIIYLNEL